MAASESYHSTVNGFSLIELSVIISIAAAITVGYLSWTNPALISDAGKLIETRSKMLAIIEAIENFKVKNGRLPCPADPNMREDNSYSQTTDFYPNGYGLEDIDIIQTPVNGKTTLGIDCPISLGAIPFNSIGIKKEYISDGWDRLFTYHISQSLCGEDDGTGILTQSESRNKGCSKSDYNNNTGDLTVSDSNQSIITENAAFVIVSHGVNGYGAYLKSGTRLTSSDNDDEHEIENYDTDAHYIQSQILGTYDDLVFYRTKNQIESITNKKDLKLVSIERCQANSALLNRLSISQLNTISTELDRFEIGSSEHYNIFNKGDEVTLGVMLTLQDVCITYYGTDSETIEGWSGPKCPGTGRYDVNQKSCRCPTGQWNNCCPGSDWNACLSECG